MSDDRKARHREISDGLLRQRRNLLLISLIMPVFFLSDASVEKINLLGTVITVGNAKIIKYSILILYGYFFLRYWQYYQEETYVQDMKIEMRRYLYQFEMSSLNKKAREKAGFAKSDILSVCFADPKYNWGLQFTAIPENRDRVIFPFIRECEFYIYPDSRGHSDREVMIKEFHSTLTQPEYSNWHPVVTPEQEGTIPSFYREYIRYNIIKFYFMRLAGVCRYMFNESCFTDYQFPFIVAIASIGLTVFSNAI